MSAVPSALNPVAAAYPGRSVDLQPAMKRLWDVAQGAAHVGAKGLEWTKECLKKLLELLERILAAILRPFGMRVSMPANPGGSDEKTGEEKAGKKAPPSEDAPQDGGQTPVESSAAEASAAPFQAPVSAIVEPAHPSGDKPEVASIVKAAAPLSPFQALALRQPKDLERPPVLAPEVVDAVVAQAVEASVAHIEQTCSGADLCSVDGLTEPLLRSAQIAAENLASIEVREEEVLQNGNRLMAAVARHNGMDPSELVGKGWAQDAGCLPQVDAIQEELIALNHEKAQQLAVAGALNEGLASIADAEGVIEKFEERAAELGLQGGLAMAPQSSMVALEGGGDVQPQAMAMRP
jgi:hypothetical protein